MKSKFFYFFIFLIIFSKYSLAYEQIKLSGNIIIERPLEFIGKEVRIEKNSIIKINENLEHVIHIKNGRLVIDGTVDEPVIIIGNETNNEDSNLIFIEDSECEIKYSYFKNCCWCLHVHNSNISIINSLFENSYGGIRFFNSKTYIKKNLFLKNYIAMRFIQSNSNIIENNIFQNNEIAIFLREGLKSSNIKFNVFIENKFDFYAGFFQNENLNFPDNYFLSTPSIFDKNLDRDLTAIINVHPVLKLFPDWH